MAAKVASTTRAMGFNATHYSAEYACYSAMGQFLDFRHTPNKLSYFIMKKKRRSILK